MEHDCNTCKYCNVWTYSDPCQECNSGNKWEPQSNADRIRAMSDEELAEILPNKSMWNCPPDIKEKGGCPGKCVSCWLNWLKQEVIDA